MLAKVVKRILKAVIKACKRGERQSMYAYNDVKQLLESAHLDSSKLAREAAEKEEAAHKNALQNAERAISRKKTLRSWSTSLRMSLTLGRRLSTVKPGPPE